MQISQMNIKKVILFTSVSFASGILFVNIYNSLVNAVAVDSDIPNSVIATREYFKVVNPGDFFKIFSPLTQVFALLSLIVLWKRSKSVRMFLGLAFLCYLSADIFTFIYFHPRNDIMFKLEPLPDTGTLKRLSSEWMSMNWLRSLIVFAGIVFSFCAIDRIYSEKIL
ncbi:MAG: DUF1772 domain-containing protein [Flavobacterium sp.]|uniref:DUF1772 domain-containing protein n=1 Tax=Flavobacterium sp. TaxID=239 RepID=UPI001225E5B6|nr:DUF1772 domain-containing protein [Flavobacterium sp.]RZJ65907.1 MAG: DUF1772 domain-containing protein [Flavobacterium sp.]